MSALRPPGLGPIIGHTTHESCRLWIQAAAPDAGPGGPGADRRSVGVIGLLSEDRRVVAKAYYFRLPREFDRSGTFVLGRDVALGRHAVDGVAEAEQESPIVLEPERSYTVRMATLSVDDPAEDADSVSDRQLADRLPAIESMAPLLLELDPDECEVTIRTFPDPSRMQDRLSFLLGSCRYPGLLWKVKEADRIFGPMQQQLAEREEGREPRFTLMVGDQIYADALNRHIPLVRADTYEEFQERYRTAFSSPNMRRLLRTAPTYMILDDHEIEDNWSQDRLRKKHQFFQFAIGAYMSYQWSHGPRTFGRRLYYRFECGGYPFFVLDARTQRVKSDRSGLRDNHLLGRPTIDPAHPAQLQRLLEWLGEQQEGLGNVPKFVGCATVFAPNSVDERIDRRGRGRNTREEMLYRVNAERRDESDSWPAYPSTRSEILEEIARRKIQNVVFLTGDIHCSNIARIAFREARDGDEGLRDLFMYDVTSSAFYWPFPFADGDPNAYVHDSRKREQLDPFPLSGGEVHYSAWAFTQEDSFCRIEVDRPDHRLRVRYYGRRGEPVEVANARGEPVHTSELELAPWG